MYQGSTPPLKFTFSNTTLNLDKIVKLTLTFESKGYSHKWTEDRVRLDAENLCATIKLTQEETLEIPVGLIDVQFKFLDEDGNCFPSTIKSIPIRRVLDKEVLE